MTLLPTTILRVILIGVPPSTWWPTSPSQTITFSTVLPSILKTVWYPACLLELQEPKFSKPQSTVNLSRPLYPTFVVYLSTIGGRLSFLSIFSESTRGSHHQHTDGIINNLKNVSVSWFVSQRYKRFSFRQAPKWFFLWRERDSNPRPQGYEPCKLPLLYPAIYLKELTQKKPQTLYSLEHSVWGCGKDFTPYLPSVSQR